MSKFAVTLNYHGNYGYVEYDSENKKAEIPVCDIKRNHSVGDFEIKRERTNNSIPP